MGQEASTESAKGGKHGSRAGSKTRKKRSHAQPVPGTVAGPDALLPNVNPGPRPPFEGLEGRDVGDGPPLDDCRLGRGSAPLGASAGSTVAGAAYGSAACDGSRNGYTDSTFVGSPVKSSFESTAATRTAFAMQLDLVGQHDGMLAEQYTDPAGGYGGNAEPVFTPGYHDADSEQPSWGIFGSVPPPPRQDHQRGPSACPAAQVPSHRGRDPPAPGACSSTAPAPGFGQARQLPGFPGGQVQQLPGAGGGPGPMASTLWVRIAAAYNLAQKDTGLFGDVSDPYVIARVGQVVHKTLCIDNDLNPVWEQGNEFSFPVSGDAGMLELEVFNSNVVKDDSLGHARVPLWQLVPGQRCQRRQRLEGTDTGELEFEVHFSLGWDGRGGGSRNARQTPEPELEYQLGSPVQQSRACALPLAGIRVLELSRRTWCSALCGRLLAASGADVVRVSFGEERLNARKKSAPDGHTAEMDEEACRNALERARASTVPRKLHAGKRLAPHNLEDPQELALLKAELLPGCDLILTDLPADELESLQLGYNTVRQQYPATIFVHTSCVGMMADLDQRGVEDAGAFYCLTGFAEQLGHQLGPTGFAAATSASALFGVACLAVMRRRCGGPGDRVELSIFRTGRWCTAFGALTGWARPPQPDRHFGREQDAATARGPTLPFDLEGAATVPPAAGARNSASLEPLHLEWRTCEGPLRMPTPSLTPVGSELPLARVSVIEIGDEYHISAAAIGSMLADLGARVTKIERPQRPDPWNRMFPQLYKDLNGKKTIKVMNYTDLGGATKSGEIMDGQAALYRSLADTTMLITNLPVLALETWGYEIPRLRALFPHLIIVQVSTWGIDAAARAREMEGGHKGGQEQYAFWEASGLSSKCFANLTMPPGLGELAVAQHALAGIGLALLRQQRSGKGQLVHVSRYQSGLFSRLISEVEPATPLASPLLELQEGRFVRVLGRGGRPHDAWMLLQALGKRGSLWKKGGRSQEGVRRFLGRYTLQKMRADREELIRCARDWSYDDLAKAFKQQGIDWFAEELRPVDAEALHKKRAGEADELRIRYQDAVERALQERENVEKLEASLKNSKTTQQASLRNQRQRQEEETREKQQRQQEEQQRMALLQQQYQQGIAPDIIVTVQNAKGLHSVTKGEKPDTYCVCQVTDKAFSRFQTPEIESNPNPEWHYSHVLNGYFFGESLMFVVYHKDPEPPKVEKVQDELHTSMLYMKVLRAFNLKNTDSGLMGDVSDPYVTVRVGDVEQKTPVIKNDLNPVWKENNEFSFRIPDSPVLDIKVFNSNTFQDDCIGRFQFKDTRSFQAGQWQPFRVPLLEGDGAELEFDVFFKPAEPCKPAQHTDELLGRAMLEANDFYPNGFEGPLRLHLASHDSGSALWVSVQVEPSGMGGPANRSTSQLSIPGSQGMHRGGTALSPSMGSWSGQPVPLQSGQRDAARRPTSNCSSPSPHNAMQTMQSVPPLGTFQSQDMSHSKLNPMGSHKSSMGGNHGGTGGRQGEPAGQVGQGPQDSPSGTGVLLHQDSGSSMMPSRGPSNPGFMPPQCQDSHNTMMPSRGPSNPGLMLPQHQDSHSSIMPSRCSSNPGLMPPQRQDSCNSMVPSRGPSNPAFKPAATPMLAALQGTWAIDDQNYATVDDKGRVQYNGQHLGSDGDLHVRGGLVQRNDGWTFDMEKSSPSMAVFTKPGGGSFKWHRYQGPLPGVSPHGSCAPHGRLLPDTSPCSSPMPDGTPYGAPPPGCGSSFASGSAPVQGSSDGRSPAARGAPYPGSGFGRRQGGFGQDGLSPSGGRVRGCPEAAAPTVEEPKSMLHIRVTGALNLVNKDTGIFGDVSDPYVVVRFGDAENKTKTINNDLNPIWDSDNLFSFNVDLQEALLKLEVMNSNVVKDDSLGSTEIDLRAIQLGRWCQFRERLVGVKSGEIEFDAFLQLTEYHRMVMEYTSLLYVRVNCALNLRNMDTGVLGDVSDPYVVLRVRQGEEQHTPTIMNDLNPTWHEGNQFTLEVNDDDVSLELEVKNANFRKDDMLGGSRVELHKIPSDQWVRFKEKLQDGDGAELEFDVYFKPTAHYKMLGEVRKAKDNEGKLGAEAASLAKQVQMADYAMKWLGDVAGNTKMPLCVEERVWEQACGGRNLVIPAWITVTSTQVDALRTSQRPQPVALFPEIVTGSEKSAKLQVKMLNAEGLHSMVLGDWPNAYCTCEIPKKPRSKIRTKFVPGSPCPEWNHTQTVKDYVCGDALILEVYNVETDDAHFEDAGRRQKGSELLGKAWLKGEQFYPNGFDGLLSLFHGTRSTDASLRVMAFVTEEVE